MPRASRPQMLRPSSQCAGPALPRSRAMGPLCRACAQLPILSFNKQRVAPSMGACHAHLQREAAKQSPLLRQGHLTGLSSFHDIIVDRHLQSRIGKCKESHSESGWHRGVTTKGGKHMKSVRKVNALFLQAGCIPVPPGQPCRGSDLESPIHAAGCNELHVGHASASPGPSGLHRRLHCAAGA